MVSKKRFSIIGGDIRQIYAAKELEKRGHDVYVCGFKDLDNKKYKSLDIIEAIDKSDYIILPLPITRDEIHLNAPFSSHVIEINDDLISKCKNKVIFGGIVTSLSERVKNSTIKLKDYYDREDFMILNAIPTAEGAIRVALEEYKNTLWNSKVLVVGYGRIGKVLADRLKGIGANVTVSARNPRDIAWAYSNNFETINISEIDSELDFDIIFNTVPKKILVYENMKLIKNCKLIIDLASLPGGVDKDSAKKLGIEVINALGLPGKFFPECAGRIIVDTIFKIIQEENL